MSLDRNRRAGAGEAHAPFRHSGQDAHPRGQELRLAAGDDLSQGAAVGAIGQRAVVLVEGGEDGVAGREPLPLVDPERTLEDGIRQVADSIAEAVGPEVITDIRLVLDPALPVRPSPSTLPETPAPVARPDKPLPKEIADAADGVDDDSLREAVLRAARANI